MNQTSRLKIVKSIKKEPNLESSIRSPLKIRDPYDPVDEDKLYKLDPHPFRHDNKNLGVDITTLDTIPMISPEKAFNKSLRKR